MELIGYIINSKGELMEKIKNIYYKNLNYNIKNDYKKGRKILKQSVEDLIENIYKKYKY